LQITPGSSRTATIVWLLVLTAGSVGVWYLSSFLDGLATLAQSDPGAALSQFRSRALPALVLIVAIAVAAGATLMRQGLQLANRAQAGDEPAAVNRGRRTAGTLIAVAGFLVAAVPLVLLCIVLWFLQRT
jgi:hypothetical protein